MHKQKNGYGCGLYAVANAINLPESFITPERLEASKAPGSTNGGLSKQLQEDGHNFYLQPLFYDGSAVVLPKAHTEYTVSGEVNAWPIILCVTLSEGGLSHMIGAKLDKFGSLYVYDSLRDRVFVTTLEEVYNHYHSVFGLYAFCDLFTGNYAFL